MAVSIIASNGGVSEAEVLAIVNPVIAQKADLDAATGYVAPTQLPPASPQQAQGTYLEVGGRVVYLSTAYDFRVSPSTYVIQGSRYSSALTDVSLDAADATHDRFDAIVVDTSGAVTVVKGTPAANPSSPDVDPLTQLTLSSVLVTANSTTPDITTVSLYAENTEWTSSVSGGTINAASTSTPFAGTKCIEATSAVSGNYVRLTTTPAISLAAQKQLVLMLQAKASFPSQKSLRLTWYSGSVKIGQTAVISNNRYEFNHSLTTYQQIVIPITDFAVPTSSTVDRLEILVNGSGASIGFRIDNISLEPNSTAVDTVLTLEGSQISGPYSTCGMTMAPNKVLGRNSSGIGPAEELNIVDLIPQQDELLTDIADFVTNGSITKTLVTPGDTNGIFYFAGTNYGASAWSNPVTLGNITIVRPHNPANSQDSVYVNRNFTQCEYQETVGAYILVDLGVGCELVVNGFTFTSSNCLGNAYLLRNFKLQGTNFITSLSGANIAAATWTDLSTHVNDSTSSAAAQTVGYTVSNVTTGYRYLRILQTGLNSSNTNHFNLAQWELYGAFTYVPTPSGGGSLEFTGTSSGTIRTQSTLTATTTGTQNDLNLAGYGTLLCNNASSTTINGVVAGSYNGQKLTIASIGAGSVVINHQNTGSTAANRIISSTGSAITLTAGTGRAELIYDSTNSRWRVWSIQDTAASSLTQGDGLTVTDAGFRGVPQNSQSADYTLVASDAGKHIYHPSADTTARTWTIPANASVAFPIGTTITFVNDSSAGVITIAITSDTLVLAGDGTTGSRSLAANGVATAIKVTSTRWQINGSGLT